MSGVQSVAVQADVQVIESDVLAMSQVQDSSRGVGAIEFEVENDLTRTSRGGQGIGQGVAGYRR